MDRQALVKMKIDCPHCGLGTEVRFPALVASGLVPQVEDSCQRCRKRFKIQASLDVHIDIANAGHEARRQQKQEGGPQ